MKGIEVDILEDGSLDLADKDLCRIDIVVGVVHGHFRLSRQKQTERILRAMDHPYFTILPTPAVDSSMNERPTMWTWFRSSAMPESGAVF